MKVSEIYEAALYLCEKTDDSTGYIDDEYKSYHKMKATELIRQAAATLAATENIPLLDVGRAGYEDEVNLPYHICRFIIPLYVAAMLAKHDGEEEKYNILIYEYQEAVKKIKHTEESVINPTILEGLR